MATIKSYTDIEQSRKLAEILPLESADMHYTLEDFVDEDTGDVFSIEKLSFGHPSNKEIGCWSLAALLGVLSLPRLIQDKADDELFWQCSAYDEDGILLCEIYDNNPIDACYEMILKLHELKML